MYMRVTRSNFDPVKLDDVLRLGDAIAAALQGQPGFQGYYDAVDRGAGRGTLVTFWDTEEHARVPRAAFGDLVPRLQALGLQPESPEFYEVVAQKSP